MANYTFIAYASENSGFVVKLAQALEQHGVKVWLDQWQASDSALWEQPAKKALSECSHFLVVLSPEALSSWVVRDQTVQAIGSDKAVVPVLYKPCSLPMIFSGRPLADFSTGHFHHNLIALLVDFYRITVEPSPPRARLTWERLGELQPRLGTNMLWLVLVLLGAGLCFLLRPASAPSEPVEMPIAVETLPPAEPVLVPTIDTLPVVNAQPTPVKAFRRAVDGSLMLFIPAGDFLMGSVKSDTQANQDEKPQHLVYLDDFWIDEVEVSNEAYRQCVEAGSCTLPQIRSGIFSDGDLPVVGVNWEQAATYCRWAGTRLPTEAEWEKAARGVDGRIYPWGDQFDGSLLNYCDANCVADWRDFGSDDGFRYTAPVGSYPVGASPYGVLDMSGNVWEWTADWYSVDAYADSIYKNPIGPEDGLQKVIRGGSWYYPSQSVRIARRHKDVAASAYDNIGFRCALSDAKAVVVEGRQNPAGSGQMHVK